jgi:hypothetical protein
MKKFINFILIFIVQYCNGQTYNIDSLFNKFKEEIQFEQKYHAGCIVWDDETKLAFYQLMAVCPVDTLIKYTNDSNPAIRAQVFSELAYIGDDDSTLITIKNKHVNDTVRVSIWPFDTTVIEYMNMFLRFRSDSTIKRNHIDYKKRIQKIKEEPRFIIKGLQHKRISKDDLLNVDSLICSEKDYKIVSFSLITNNGIELISFESSSNVLSSEMKKGIMELITGNKIYIEDIKAVGIDGSHRILSQQSFFIK